MPRHDRKAGQKVRVAICGAMVGLLLMPGCDSLMEVDADPEIVRGGAGGALSLQEILIGAEAALQQAYDEKNLYAGLFGDVFTSAGPGQAHRLFSARVVTADEQLGVESHYVPLQRLVAMSGLGEEDILDGNFPELPNGSADSKEYARLSLFEGFGKLWLADGWCTVAFRGTGPELTSREAYQEAAESLTEAIEAAEVEEDVRQAALIGRARVRLILGDDAGAAADARQVDPTFEYRVEYSTATFDQQNQVYFHTYTRGDWTVSPRFHGLTIDDTEIPDPRTLVEFRGPAYVVTEELWVPLKVTGGAAPLTVASGDEAQYIIAEVEGGDAAVDIINEVRARNGIDQEWTPSGSGPNEVRDKLIEERFRTLFLEGVHLGDLRRYIDKYGLDLFPTTTPQGIPVSDATCIPLPSIERENNPDI